MAIKNRYNTGNIYDDMFLIIFDIIFGFGVVLLIITHL